MIIPMNSRPNFIDYSKTIGLFLVILGHFVYHFQLPFVPSSIWKLCHFITLFHMPLFFIISGLLIKEDHISAVFKKVVYRLVIPYALICGICMVLGCLISVCRGDTINLPVLKNQFWAYVSASDLFNKGFDKFSSAMWFCYALAWIQLCYAGLNKYWKICAVLGGVFLMYQGNILPFRFDSALVGLIFFLLGHYGKVGIMHLISMRFPQQLLFFFLSLVLLLLAERWNLDYNNRQALSINAMYFGKYPPLFIISGITGTIVILLLAVQISKARILKQFVLTISKGSIIVLGFHKMIAIATQDIINIYSIPVALCYSAFNLFICFFLIRFFMKYFPIILGNRI